MMATAQLSPPARAECMEGIDYCAYNSASRLYIPAGDYRITDSLRIPSKGRADMRVHSRDDSNRDVLALFAGLTGFDG